MALKKGLLIVFEGIDGAGKSTQANLLSRKLKARALDVLCFREPSRGKWGKEIKKKARRPNSLSPEEELILFVKDREENVRKNLKPALEARKIVLLDRYYYSTIAYQGARGIDVGRIKRMNERFAVEPDLVFILDLDAQKGLRRIEHRKIKDKLFEREKYLTRVRRIFKSFAGRKFVHMNALQPPEVISRQIEERVQKLLKRYSS